MAVRITREGSDPLRSLFASAAAFLARLILSVFYREVEVAGGERVPPHEPLIFVANHGNSMIDPILLVGFLPRRVRFLAKSTLWNNPFVVPFLWLGGAVPVERRQDLGDAADNRATFARCHDELADGGCIALFPEGMSYHAPELQPLRTGAARIALGAEVDGAPQELRIIPVGLTFEDKGIFRSRVLLSIGEPIDPTPQRITAGEDLRHAVRELTERIEAGLRSVTLNHPSWHMARLIERAVEVHTSGDETASGETDLATRFSLQQTFGQGYERARERFPERLERLERLAHRYDATLYSLGLRDDHVTARSDWSRAVVRLGNRAPMMILGFPFAAVGIALNYLPYRAAGLVADAIGKSPDLPATYKVFTSVFLFPLVWVLESLVAQSIWGFWGGVTVGFGAPLTGYAAMLFRERYDDFIDEACGFLTMRMRKGRAAELRAVRVAIQSELSDLVADLSDEDDGTTR
jgi:1-acyl-sn-glycerol-3-phosphate acyltransferase